MKRSPINELAAALMLFTRLPLGRVWPMLPIERFNHAVTWWPAVGWLTAGVAASTLWLLSPLTGTTVAAVTALALRMLLTGGLHEDGLADVADGLGGRVDRDRALAIMKDSQIGSYGVLALIIYCLLFVATTTSMSASLACWMIICADPWSRFCAGRLIAFLPYARREGAKNGLNYPHPTAGDWIVALCFGITPIVWFSVVTSLITAIICASVAIVTMLILVLWYKKRLGGYTGDCCGASYLICESTFMLTFSALHQCNLYL